MITHHFFVPPEQITEKVISLCEDQAKHLFVVLRVKPRDEVVVFDGQGNQYRGIVRTCSSVEGVIDIKSMITLSSDFVKITLVAAIPKKAKFDDIVDKATQLGVNQIIPIETQNSVVKIPETKRNQRHIRWQKIAVEAAKQSGRGTIPEILPVHSFFEAIMLSRKFKLGIIACCFEGAVSLREIARRETPDSIIAFIGPEGDFSRQELEVALEHGLIHMSLGKNILRCDTAANAMMAVLRYEWQ